MRTALVRLSAAAALATALALPSPAAWARPKAKPKPAPAAARAAELRLGLLDAAYDKLPFGGDLDAVMTWVRARLDATYGPRLKAALDDAERMTLRKALDDELARVRQAVIPFEGGRSGLEASIVAGEFVDGAGESVLLFKDGEVTHYLFFTQGKLYKVARAFKPAEPFGERVAAWTRDFGTPELTAATAGTDPQPETATWTGQKLRLRLAELRRLYHGDQLVIEDVALATQVDARRGGKKPGTARQMDPELEGLLDDGE